MNRTLAVWSAALATLACTGSLSAHHSGYMYETTPVWVRGTVVSFERINPHTIITLEERSADGQVRRWTVEGPPQLRVDRMGIDVPAVGDVIEFCTFPYKSAEELSRMFPGADFSARRTAEGDGSSQSGAGHVLVMPDGEKRLWEPHGLMSECIRSSDADRGSWVEFIDSAPSVRQAWCEQMGHSHVQSTESLKELVEEIDGLIDNPCG